MTMNHSVTQVFTAEDLLMMPDDGFRYELVRGELIKMVPPGGEHGSVAMNIGSALHQFVKTNNLGIVYAAETGFQLERNPDTVRAPDAAFICRERAEKIGRVTGYIPGAPDLAIEVISPTDTYTEVEDKVFKWLDSGTRMVIVVNPRKRTVTIYRSRTDIRVLTENDILDGGDVVPGWTIPVREIFA